MTKPLSTLLLLLLVLGNLVACGGSDSAGSNTGGTTPTTTAVTDADAGSAVSNDAANQDAVADSIPNQMDISGTDILEDMPPHDVRIIAPVDGAAVCGTTTIEVAASDDRQVASVTVLVNDEPLAVLADAPYQVVWDTHSLPNGMTTIMAVAVDDTNQQTSTTATVDIANDNPALCDQLPTIALIAPSDMSYVTDLVEVEAIASDDQGVTSVAFFVDNAQIALDDAAPYHITWNTNDFAEGVHTLKAVATDTNSQTASVQHTVTVDRTPPSIEIESPMPGETVVAEVPVRVVPTDNVLVTSVIVTIGDTTQTLNTPPWELVFDLREHEDNDVVLVATATDVAGLSSEMEQHFRLDRPPWLYFNFPRDGRVYEPESPGETTYIEVHSGDDGPDPTVAVYADDVALPESSFGRGDQFVWRFPDTRSSVILRAVATDSRGQTTEEVITVHVDQQLQVSVLRCDEEACTSIGRGVLSGLVRFEADASDDEPIRSVTYELNGEELATLEEAPWPFELDTTTLPEGEYQLRATVTNEREITSTTTYNVTINNCDRDGDYQLADTPECGGVDCDDGDLSVFLGGREICDGIDNDCDGMPDVYSGVHDAWNVCELGISLPPLLEEVYNSDAPLMERCTPPPCYPAEELGYDIDALWTATEMLITSTCPGLGVDLPRTISGVSPRQMACGVTVNGREWVVYDRHIFQCNMQVLSDGRIWYGLSLTTFGNYNGHGEFWWYYFHPNGELDCEFGTEVAYAREQ